MKAIFPQKVKYESYLGEIFVIIEKVHCVSVIQRNLPISC